jgi:hypothetical protein
VYYKSVMKKLLATTVLVILICSSSVAASLNIGTHASFYAPPEGGGNTLMAGIDATYRLNSYFSARGDLDASNYQSNDHKYSLTSLSVTLIGHLLGSSSVDPYLGAGIGLYDKRTDDVTDRSTGFNALAGIAVHFPTFNLGIEVKYVLPDTRHMDAGFYTMGGNMTGGLHVDL